MNCDYWEVLDRQVRLDDNSRGKETRLLKKKSVENHAWIKQMRGLRLGKRACQGVLDE